MLVFRMLVQRGESRLCQPRQAQDHAPGKGLTDVPENVDWTMRRPKIQD
jgi:hypothetical protein